MNGSKVIDSVAASCRVIEYIEEWKLLASNEVVYSNHYLHVFDVLIEDYFDENFNY